MDVPTIVDARRYFAGLGARQGVKGPIGELTAHLSAGLADREFFYGIVDRYGLEHETWFRPQRLDLMLGFANECLSRHELLNPIQLAYLHSLKKFLQVEDGEFLAYRPSETAHLLREQLEAMLSDKIIDVYEDVHLSGLQSLFGLGYDEFLSLTRVTFERTWADLQSAILRDDVDQNLLRIKMKLLEPIVRLATMQRRSLGALNS